MRSLWPWHSLPASGLFARSRFRRVRLSKEPIRCRKSEFPSFCLVRTYTPCMKTILITGASRGIGAAAARLAAERGYAVCINYCKNAAAANLLVQEIEGKGGKAIAIQADVAVETDVVRLFEKVDRSFGPLNALVNNAGIVEQQTRLDQMKADRLQRIFSTNV